MNPFGWDITFQSFISTTPISGISIEDQLNASKWVFFSSPSGVRHFNSSFGSTCLEGKKIAAFGPSTAKQLSRLGVQVDFVGQGKNHSVIAKSFYSALGSDKAVFPIGNLSNKTVQSEIPEAQIENVLIYQSSLLKIDLDQDFDTYVFTSPSNVRGFLSKNSIPKSATVISIGNSTSLELQKNGISSVSSWEHSTFALADAIMASGANLKRF